MQHKTSKVIMLVVVLLLVTFHMGMSAIQDPISSAASTFTTTSQTHSLPVASNSFWGPAYTRPYPTNTWWINLIMSGNNPIKTYPYIVRASNNGYHVCYPGRTVARTFIFETFLDNLIIGATQSIGTRQVVSHSDLSVTVRYSSGSGSMTSPIVRGQAYHSVEYAGLTPRLTTAHVFTGVNGGGLTGSYTGTKLKLALNNGQTWLIYTSSAVTWTITGNSATASGAFTGTLRAAYLMSSNQESVYDTYSSGYPVSGRTVLSTSNNEATIRFTFTKKGSSPLLMFLLPHHRDIITNANYATPEIRYKSMKGEVVAMVGDEWVMKEKLISDIGFYSRYTIPTNNVAALKAQLARDQNSYPAATDPYFGSKAAARLGRLAVIADELGETAIATKIRNNMKSYVNKWLGFGSASDNTLLYERTYGGLVSKNSVGSSGADFGNYYYNDHHFHYGYLVYAAACIIKKDVAWGQTYKTKLMEIVRDFANPSTSDTAYTTLRNKDWYTGHSYAAGLFAFADSRNQESTSEAVNAYYGVYTLGLAYNDANLRDLGRILMQTEIRSSQKYWQITSADNIYESTFAANKVVGILWETKADYATWFGANVEYIHGIQMLPYTPITEDLLRPNWIREAYTVFSSAYTRSNPAASSAWLGLLYQAQATFDKPGAAAKIATLNGVDDGNTMTNTLYWLYTRPDSTNKVRTNPFADIDAYTGQPPQPDPSPEPEQPEPSEPEKPVDPGPIEGDCINCGGYGTVICGKQCINSDKHKCCNGAVIANTQTCGGTPEPSNPTTDPACANINCASGFKCCAGACYNPNVHVCTSGGLCPVGTQRCGNACYSPTIYKCCNGALRTLNASC